MGISKVALMGRSTVNLGLVERGNNLVGEDACRKARNHFGNFGFIRSMQNVVIDEYVVPEERELNKIRSRR